MARVDLFKDYKQFGAIILIEESSNLGTKREKIDRKFGHYDNFSSISQTLLVSGEFMKINQFSEESITICK